ncbi:hypothetical protein [Chitinophaga nivalis]|uniref:Uncharacterized protein n=1 Tax=Chitinophaga nivalis TaxID=2991709 RepID=A0ABT3ITU8_9BACT|nr:hypothetical protein [Chitinophaga nivalis]MCW3462922.1 hypothetical protein [Chitinophaga nivalis]MCW3487388.1 hypothetical protein [Chitinophaga nivalis]
MGQLFKQYQKELRNILILALLIALSSYLPQLLHFAKTFAGTMVCMGIICGYILGMSLKVYYRIVVMRIKQETAL